jgi:hypothetical protein
MLIIVLMHDTGRDKPCPYNRAYPYLHPTEPRTDSISLAGS